MVTLPMSFGPPEPPSHTPPPGVICANVKSASLRVIVGVACRFAILIESSRESFEPALPDGQAQLFEAQSRLNYGRGLIARAA